MKNVTINTAAAWAGTFRSYQDGDIFRESNIDLSAGDLADRLGYLKATVDGKPGLADNNTWTGTQTFNNVVTFTGTVQQTGNPDFQLSGSPLEIGNIVCDGDISFPADDDSGVSRRIVTGSDANATIDAAADEIRVPTLTANRTWTFNAVGPRPGALVRIIRNSNLDAFTLTVKRGDGTTIAVFAASTATFAEFSYTSKWVTGATGSGISAYANTD